MIPISKERIQRQIEQLRNTPLYIHLELTTGAYASHTDKNKHPAANFIRNAVVTFHHGMIEGNGPYRIGLKMEHGWVYAEGLTHMEAEENERLVLTGMNNEGKLVVAFQLSKQPF